MTEIKDVLTLMCRKVEPITGAGHQQIFIVEDVHQARMAYELFTTLGFDVKLYAENQQAKFYYIPASEPADKTERKLEFACSHARILGSINQAADRLKNDAAARVASYQITYSNPNIAGSDKRIVLDLLSPEAPHGKSAISSQSNAAAIPAAAAKSPVASKKKKPQLDDNDIMEDFSAGPQVAKKTLYKMYKEQMEKQDEDSLYVQLVNYLKSQRATTAFWVVIYLGGILVVYSFFVLAQAYLCPDLATVKKNYWYCTYK